jgi:hypothetical protein
MKHVEFHAKINVKLVHLVGLIIKKFVTMHGHMNIKKCNSNSVVTVHGTRNAVTVHGTHNAVTVHGTRNAVPHDTGFVPLQRYFPVAPIRYYRFRFCCYIPHARRLVIVVVVVIIIIIIIIIIINFCTFVVMKRVLSYTEKMNYTCAYS